MIEHKGTIVVIEDNRVDVAITSHPSCEGCRAKSLCGMTDDDQKIVSIVVDHPEAYSVGEMVEVVATVGMGMKAVTYAYIYPFFVLFIALIILVELGAGDVISGGGALAALALYYIILYYNRERVEREIVFKIKKYNG